MCIGSSVCRERLSETAAAPKTGDADGLIASLKEQLQDKMRECTYLQGECAPKCHCQLPATARSQYVGLNAVCMCAQQ